MNPAIIVHGGAGRWSLVFKLAEEENLPINEESVIHGVRKAASMGFRVLSRGGSALDAVVEAIKYMENSGLFNAGIASSLDAAGNLSMDTGLMDGSTSTAIGIACLSIPKNPIILARTLLGKTDHVIIGCGIGDEIAVRIGVEKHPGPHPRALAFHKWAKKMLQKRAGDIIWKRNIEFAKILGLLGDTVGAVAIDRKGNIAAGVSTGGVNYKIPGRIGDSPIPCAGFYALNNIGGVAATRSRRSHNNVITIL